MIAVDGLAGCDLKPLCEQILLRCSGKSSYIGACECKAAQAEVLEHRRRQAKMIPGTAVVSGPGGSVSLASREGRAGKHERANVWIQVFQTIEGGPGIFHSVDVVNFRRTCRAFDKSRLVDAVNHIFGHGLRGSVEDGRFVHVIPETSNAHFGEVAIEIAPPLPGLRPCEVGENALARPDRA